MNRYIPLTAASAGGGLLAAAFLQATIAAADTAGTAAEISANAFTVGGTTFDPGSDGFTPVDPLAAFAPLLSIGGGTPGGLVVAPQDLEAFGSGGSDLGTVHTAVSGISNLLGIDTAQFTVQSVTPDVAEVEAALTNSDLDFSGASFTVDDLAAALTLSPSTAGGIPYGTDITASNVQIALLVGHIHLTGTTITNADIASVLNGVDVSDLPAAGTVYSFTNLGSGWANIYEAVPNDDGTAASSITDTLVTPFGKFNIPTGYDAVAHLGPGAAFAGFAATSDNAALSDHAFTIDGTTFDPGSDGFTSQIPTLGLAPLLELSGGQVTFGSIHLPFGVPQDLEVYNSGGTDLGSIITAVNGQNLLGIDATQLSVTGYNLSDSDVVSALSGSGVNFAGAGTTAADVAHALGTIGTATNLSWPTVYTELNSAGIHLSIADATTVANALNSAAADFTPSAGLPAEGTVYSVTNLGSGFANLYIATPNADGTAAAHISDTFVTPFGNLNIPTSYDAIAPMDPGAAFAGLGVGTDASGLSDHAFTIDGITFDPGTDGFTAVSQLSGNAPLLEMGGGTALGTVLATQDLDVYNSSGAELGSIRAGVDTMNLLGLIESTQLTVTGYNIPAADLVSALGSSDISFTGAGFTASDLVNALESNSGIAALLGNGEMTGTLVTNGLRLSGINLSAAGINPDDVAAVINAAAVDYQADLPADGTVYSVTNLGFGFENVYWAVPNADGDAAASIHDVFMTPLGNLDLSTMFDAVAQLNPGDAVAGIADIGAAASGAFDLFDPSTWF